MLKIASRASRWRARFSVMAGLALALCVSSAHAATPRVTKRVLANGLTVLVQENHAAPVVAVRIYVKTGSIYEGQYLGAGISHLFEHTLFEGTTTRTKEQINDDIQGMGGQSNAYTSYDVTAYHITTATPYFSRAVNLLGDMVRNATFPAKEVETQQGVIHNEMNLGEDDPDRVLALLYNATAFIVHPVRYPVIGFRAPFDALTRDDILSYYKSHYTPENSVLSIAGDVTTAQALSVVQREMGDWPRRSSAAIAVPDEPRQSAPRRASVEKNVNQTYKQIGWHTVPLQSADLYPLDVLAQVLGGGDSSRLVRVLREQKNLVTQISAYSYTPNFNAGVFAVRAVMPPNNAGKLEGEVWKQIYALEKSGVSAAELAGAKRQIETAFVFNNDSVENQAEQNASDEIATGDPEYSRRYVANIGKVTSAQIVAVAKKYLRRDGTTVVSVAPLRSKSAAAADADSAGETIGDAQFISTGAPDVSARSASTRAAKIPTKEFKLSNGVRLLVKENRASPSVAISVYDVGGARLEPAGKAGVSAAMAEMLTRGTARRSADQIAQVVAKLGGQLDGFSGYQAWGINSQWLSRDWRSGLSLVAESLLTPTFPADQLANVKAQQAAQLRQQQDDPTSAAAQLMRKTFFGNTPYGRSSLGTPATLKTLTADDVRAFWKRVLQPRSTVIAVYGDVDANAVRAAAEYSLGKFRGTGTLPKAPQSAAPLTQFTVATQQVPGLAQAVVWYGFPGITVKNDDRYAIDVLDAALSGADLPGGRLHARLRDNQLVYVVHAYDQPGVESGAFNVYAATTLANLPKVRDIIEEEVGKVQDAEISPDELARAKTMSIAAFAIDGQSNTQQAQRAALDELLGLGYKNSDAYEKRINAVTLSDVQQMARKYLRRDAAALAVIEPKS